MRKDAYYINYRNGKFYREHCDQVQKLMATGEWKRSAMFKVADLAHYPFIQVKESKVLGG